MSGEEAKHVSRREFLKGAGAGAAVAAVAAVGVEELRIINMVPSPGPELSATFGASPGTIQEGGSVRFDVTPSGGTPPYVITIDCGDGTTMNAAGNHTYTAHGRYTALLTVTDSAGKKVQAVATVVVNPTVAPTPAAEPVLAKVVTLKVNGESYILNVPANWTLLEVLRQELHLFSVHEGCSLGECGACTVIVDGKAVNSCQILAIEAEGKNILTLEGIGTPSNLHPLQAAFVKHEASQCGYCAPGMIMSAKALLDSTPKPTVDQVRQALAGNLCVCGNYKKITEAVMEVGGG
jgi:carbon-monoxide dehydrogenase small subunit